MKAPDSVEDLIPRAEIFRSKLIEDFQLLESMTKGSAEVPKYYSSEVSGKWTIKLLKITNTSLKMLPFINIICK